MLAVNRVVLGIGLAFVALSCCGLGIAFQLMHRRAAPTSGLALTYACVEPLATADAPRIQARLDEARAWAEVEVIDPSHVRVLLGEDAGEPGVALVGGAMMSRVLELMPVDESAMRTLVASSLPTGVRSEGGYGDLVVLAAPDAVSLSQVEALVPPGDRLVLACDDPAPGCRGYVTRPSELGNAEVARADASFDDLGGGGASVGLTLTAPGAARFEALTRRIVGTRIAIVLDGRALSVPVVQQPIAGGRVMITLGGDAALGEAQAIAAALGGGALSCSRWTLESQDVFGR